MLALTSQDEYNEFVAGHDTCVALFSAPWCRACARAKPGVAAGLDGMSVPGAIVNIEELDNLSETLSIVKLPTLIVYRNGADVGRAQSADVEHLLAPVRSSIASLGENPPQKRARSEAGAVASKNGTPEEESKVASPAAAGAKRPTPDTTSVAATASEQA